MKKQSKNKHLITLLMLLFTIVTTAATLTACGFDDIKSFFSHETNHDDVVCYYGCPNSKKAKRLKTTKFT